MLSSMTPTIVTRDGKVVLITGSPGGRTIINTVLTVVLGVTEYGLNGREAVDRRASIHQWLPDRVTIEAGASTRTSNASARWATRSGRRTRQGDAHSIWVAPDGTPYGADDKRSPTQGLGAQAPALTPTEPAAVGFCDRGFEHVSRLQHHPGTIITLLRRAGRVAHARRRHNIRPTRRTHRGLAGQRRGLFCFRSDRFGAPVCSWDFTKLDGLIPAVIQDDASGEVLMVGFMNEEALERRARPGSPPSSAARAASSGPRARRPGNRLKVTRILVDCDDDTVLVKVKRAATGRLPHRDGVSTAVRAPAVGLCSRAMCAIGTR